MMGNLIYPHMLRHGQAAFITSIAMAVALEKEGVGLGDTGLKQLAVKFKDWIRPTSAKLTTRGQELFLGQGDIYEAIYLDKKYNPNAPRSLMHKIASALDPIVDVAPLANVAKKLKSCGAKAVVQDGPKVK